VLVFFRLGTAGNPQPVARIFGAIGPEFGNFDKVSRPTRTAAHDSMAELRDWQQEVRFWPELAVTGTAAVEHPMTKADVRSCNCSMAGSDRAVGDLPRLSGFR
jgi:hypothetical protein